MAGTILTPTAIWADFAITEPVVSESLGVYTQGDVQVERMYLKGKSCPDGNVRIYGVLARNVKRPTAPAIYILQKFSDGADEKLAFDLALKGYTAFVVDVSGSDGINNNHTLYPQSLSFTNLINAKLFSVGQDVKKTCWYEWGCTARYALEYLKNLPNVSQIGLIGIDDAATVAWHLAGTVKTFSCAAFVSNAGWGGYSGSYKFSTKIDKEFSDEELMFLAGIEPQTYAGHVKCPTYVAVATNSGEYDFDRAHDTYAHISDQVVKAINYSVGRLNGVDCKAYDNLIKFFKYNLPLDGKKEGKIPNGLEIKCELIDGKFVINLTPDTNELKKLSVYAGEEMLNPALRQWQKLVDCKRNPDGTFTFEYEPYSQSQIAMFFGVAEYKDGFEVGSEVIARRFNAKDVTKNHKSKLIYSSREKCASSAFYPLKNTDYKPSGLSIKSDINVIEKKGAMDIMGITCESGLISFRMASKKYKPQDGSMIMLDANLKRDGEVTVSLVADYFGKKTTYTSRISVKGGEVWNNIKLESKNFKTEEGLNLKTFENIEAIIINADTEYLINNLLCV